MSGITKDRFETVVHVLLDMAVKEGKPRLIGREIDDGATIVRDDDRILNNSGRLLAVDLDQFPEVPVKVHGMGVIGAVAHDQAVAGALFKKELAFVRVRLAVHEPQIEFACAAWNFFEHKFDGLLRRG